MGSGHVFTWVQPYKYLLSLHMDYSVYPRPTICLFVICVDSPLRTRGLFRSTWSAMIAEHFLVIYALRHLKDWKKLEIIKLFTWWLNVYIVQKQSQRKDRININGLVLVGEIVVKNIVISVKYGVSTAHPQNCLMRRYPCLWCGPLEYGFV